MHDKPLPLKLLFCLIGSVDWRISSIADILFRFFFLILVSEISTLMRILQGQFNWVERKQQ